MRRFFGLDTPKVALRPTPFLRRASGDAWPAPSGSTPSPSTTSPISTGQTWAPVNTVANQDDLHELVNKIRFLASMGSEDRPLILEVCDRASTDATAREAIRALMHEFKHGSAAAQLSAARLWAILLRNSSAAFIAQSTAVDFLETIEALIKSPQTSLVVRHRVLRVLGDAVFSNPTRVAFRLLWVKVKPDDQPDHGSRYSEHDAILRPRQFNGFNALSILDRINPPVPRAQGIDSRFPYEWEAEDPPPSYETATGLFRAFSDDRVPASPSSSSMFSDASSDIDIDGDPSEGNESERWSLVQSDASGQVVVPRIPRPTSPGRVPRLQISSPYEGVRWGPRSPANTSLPPSPLSSPESPTPSTARPTAIRRLRELFLLAWFRYSTRVC
ncbi:hypothetical protein DFH07DRAFT_151335 [Mycena maculata]|uniref:VHS domain-containing protein n=1 Tax=Mycena maculata TaxID=230809 RepID=A0AAD7MUQ6_9AGAR|nr:hypothetical protein DFH07DRAFT_151335 [Mycena maculata]